MASGISIWVNRAWENVQGCAASAKDGAGRVKQSATEWAKSTFYEPLPPRTTVRSILVDTDTNENAISLDPHFPKMPGGLDRPFAQRTLVCHEDLRNRKEVGVPANDTRPLYRPAVTLEQEEARLARVNDRLRNQNQVPCDCGCGGVYTKQGPEPVSEYHWRTSLLWWTIAAIKEAVFDLFNSMYYLGIIGGVGLYSALLFGSTPITFLLHGPVAGTVAGVALATLITSVVSKIIFGGGIGIMKAKHVPIGNHQHTPRAKVAIAVITFLASVFFSYKMLTFWRTRSICQWVGDSFSSEEISEAFSLFDPLPSLSAGSLSSQVTQGIFQTRFFSYGLIASGLYTWFNKAVAAVPQIKEALQPQQRV